MKIQRSRIDHQINWNAVLGVNRQSALPKPALPLNVYLLRRQRDVVIPGLLNNRRADVFLRTRAIGRLRSLGLDRILEFVIREERRNYLESRHHQRDKNSHPDRKSVA